MKPMAALAALTLALTGTVLPAAARDSFVVDNAHLLSASTVAQINAKVADFAAQTGKEVFVDTELTAEGTPKAAAERVFAQQQINGVLIYVAKSPKTIGVLPDRASSRFFPSGSTTAIRNAIASAFNSGDFNGGVNNGVDLTLSQYRSHMGSLPRSRERAGAGASVRTQDSGGANLSWIWWLIILAVIFFVIRGIFRAMAGPRVMPPGYGGGPPMGGPGYGPGYGGMGGMGGGGGFWSGMLGGLGGAFLGNELFGRHDGGGGNYAGMGGDPGQQADAGGWQSDAGQADVGNASFGGFGDSGGDAGGGWGDSGGGGDSGGSW